MLPKIPSLSGKEHNTSSSPESPLNSNQDPKSKNELNGINMANTEKAENEIWQGIKLEKEEKLERAAFRYRSAIKLDPECAKAYRLLSNVLKRIREARNSNKKTIVSPDSPVLKLDNKTSTNNTLSTLKRKSSNLGKSELIDSSSPDLSNINLIPTSIRLNSNNSQSLSPSKGEIISLPNTETSPGGDIVLQENLAVSQVYIEQALVFFDEKQWEKSIAACQEALRTCPSMGEAYKIWGNCLQQSGNTADAMGIYAKALEVQPNMAEIYCNLGSIYAKSQKWQQAIEYYQKSIIIEPNLAAPYRNLARVWDELKEYEKSEDCFLKALAIKPELISARDNFDLAHNLSEDNKREQAIICYKNSIKLESNFLNAYVRLAQLLEEVGQTEEALYYYKKLAKLQIEAKNGTSKSKSRQQIHNLLFGKKQKSLPKAASTIPVLTPSNTKKITTKKNISQLSPSKTPSKEEVINQYRHKIQKQPNSPALYFELGNLYASNRRWQNAISCYLQGIKLAPREAKLYISLGKAWEKSGNTIKANQAFYQGFSLEPEKVSAQNHFLLGNKLLEQRQIKSAIACYRRAITFKPELIEAYWQLGKILFSGGKYQGAIACYQQALKVDPTKAHSYFCLGNIFTRTDQWQPALQCYLKAAQIEPKNADIQHNLGEALSRAKKWQDATKAYRQAIAINPNNSWSHNNLGDALLKIKEWQQAANSFREAIKLKTDFVWSHYNLAEALAELKQLDEALSEYKLAQQLDPNLPEVKHKIGAILHQRSKQSQREALAFCKEQIKEDPDNIELYHQAISLERKNPELYLGLGKALAKRGELDQAISILQVGLEIQPKHIALALELNETLLKKNPILIR